MAEIRGNNHISADDLSAYADGQITDRAEVRRIEAHLEACDRCREELDQFKAISHLLADLPEPELPRSFRISPEDLPAGEDPVPIEPWLVRHQSSFRVAAMAAVLLLVVVVTIDLLPGRTDDPDEITVMMDAPQEEAAPEDPDDNDAPGVAGVEEEDAEEPQDMPAVDQDEDAVAEPDEQPAPEAQEEAVEEEAEEPAIEPDAERQADEEALRDLATPQHVDDEGMSTLQLVAMGLAGISIILLVVGFIIPRWWSASATNR
jgi:anti-sigma factor RsiW